jgi:hypothetical protein
MHMTKEGTNITRKFTCTAADFDAGTDGENFLPVLTEAFSGDRPDLIVSDVMVYWLDNVNCRYEAMYSTRGSAQRDEIVDSSMSVRHSFNFSTSSQSADTFKRATKQWNQELGRDEYVGRTWQTFWEEQGKSGKAPDLSWHRPHLVWTVKMYLSKWYFPTINSCIGGVNSNDFLKQWLYLWPGREIDVTGDDTGKWLFAGFNSSQIAAAKFEVTMMFIYEDNGEGAVDPPKGWNFPYGVENSVDLYPEVDFDSLPFPQQEGPGPNDGLRGADLS